MRQSTLHQLKVFETVARLTSITRAAEELSLTQPTVSMQIKQLTQNIGIPLFEQIGKKLYLTQAGQELLITCREIFNELSRFEMKITDFQGLKQGKLKLATITTTKYFMPRAIAPFCQLYPGVDVALEITNHERVLERLSENLDDLYIISKIPDRLDVVLHPFLENPLVVIAPKTHPLAQEKNIPISKLQNEPFIMRERGSGTRDAVEQLLTKHGVSVKVRLELGGNEAIKQAIGVGLGISVLSQHTFTHEAALSGLTILDVQHFPIERHWYIIYPDNKQLSIVASTFFDFLQQESQAIANKMHEIIGK
ncbi:MULTISPECIES: LysR substrate-binding domain-containing protein [unclassified Chamaesiphon]|uniref:LysR family transcriptional regulator n=1 Tax=unclassified Chamaesiphon TaxID=2620921 RepID=UPI00286CAEBD|nr:MULTISPECIES: LysR substrate-binding domain-containing protein [unclassified Chamaesiphon]